MELRNILASLRHSMLGAALVALQIATTLTIVSNTVFLANGHLQRLLEPTGLAEEQIFSLSTRWMGDFASSTQLLERDIGILLATPGVIDVTAMSGIPLSESNLTAHLSREPVFDGYPFNESLLATFYWGDDHTLDTLGLRLVAGRNFRPEEVVKDPERQPLGNIPVIISQALAESAFPDGDAVGRNLYFSQPPITVIGVVEQLTFGSSTKTYGETSASYRHALFIPYHRDGRMLVVRARGQDLHGTMQEAERRLRAADPRRTISELRPYTETRRNGLRQNAAIAVMFSGVCVLLVLATAFAIIGVTNYWVVQRQRYIGMRRALGAQRSHVLRYYLGENLMIAGVGIVLGTAGAAALSLWLTRQYQMPPLDPTYLLAGAVSILLLSQLAVLWPALRAASIPPALAARTR